MAHFPMTHRHQRHAIVRRRCRTKHGTGRWRDGCAMVFARRGSDLERTFLPVCSGRSQAQVHAQARLLPLGIATHYPRPLEDQGRSAECAGGAGDLAGYSFCGEEASPLLGPHPQLRCPPRSTAMSVRRGTIRVPHPPQCR